MSDENTTTETSPEVITVAAETKAADPNIAKELTLSNGKKAIIYKIPKILIVTLAKLGDYLKFPLNSERLQKLTESYVVSNEKIVNAIGKPLPISAEEGLIQTLKSFNKI
mgnify:CR=1 FL=1